MGNPAPRLLVPGGRFDDVRPMGEGRHARFSVTSAGVRARAVAFGCDGQVTGTPGVPLDATFRLERNVWNGAVEPRLVLRHSQPCEPDAIALLDTGAGYLDAALAEMDAVLDASPSPAAAGGRAIVDCRGHSPLAVLVDAVAGGGPVLALCADVARRAPGLRERVGGFTLAAYGELEADPSAALAFAQVVALDPPTSAAGDRALRAGAGIATLAWGEPELRFAARMLDHEYGLRASLVPVYRALRSRGRAAGTGARDTAAGRRRPRPVGPAGRAAGARALRARAGALRSRSAGSRHPRSCADGTRPLARLQVLFSVVRGRQAIPEQRKSSSRRLSRAIGRGDAGGNGKTGGEKADGDGLSTVLASDRPRVDGLAAPHNEAAVENAELSPFELRLLGDLFAIVEEHASHALPVDRDRVEAAFAYSCIHHADQRRLSGEEFIIHPVGVAKICAGMRLDTETLCAALLHDTVEDTSASLEEVSETFGEEISSLVDGVTKLDGLTFQSRDEAQAENYRKMVVAMATDIRVILIKLADRLHNMRTISAMSKQKQLEKARETLDIYAPIAHRLGIHAIKWELEDLAFQTLHPRKYNEIKGLVAQQRGERERYVNEAGEIVNKELAELGIHADISGRAKHFYSIYAKMTKKGREFNEIYDLTAMRVIVDSVKDCYGAVGVIHSLWKPLPGRFKDFIAMPKFNMYRPCTRR